MTKKPAIISLYSGAGGIDYGFEAAGFRTAVALELDHDCCETMRSNRRWNVIERSIFEVPTSEILAAAKVKRGEADVLVGGPPCQPFSKAGYWVSGDSARLSDPRANTLAEYMRVVEDALPKAFLLENVGGLSYSGKNEGLEFLLERVREINRKHKVRYEPVFQVLRAADYGVPQVRERFVMIAARDGQAFEFPVATHAPVDSRTMNQSRSSTQPYRTAWDAIGDLEDSSDQEDLAVRGKWAELLPTIPEGQNYLWHTDRGGGRPLFGWRRRYWSFLLKLAKDRPSWTLQAQPGPAVGPFHWNNRRLSMRELCRLQTFPDDIVISGGRSSVQKQIGNAVPSLLAEVLGKEIRTQLFGHRVASELELLPRRRRSMPEPCAPVAVPRKFLALEGTHDAHPGTGRGYRAKSWVADAE